MSTIKVVVADDEEGYRKALRQILSATQDIELVEVARDGRDAVDVCMHHDVDVLLTDIQMPRMNGIEAIRALERKKHDLQFVVLTIHEDSEHVFEAIRAGAIGYLLKTSTPPEVIQAIRLAASGETSMTPTIATKVIESFRRQREDEDVEDAHLYELNEREMDILEFLATGLRNREIAEKLGLKEKTVKNYVSNILRALQVNSRTEAAMKAIREKLVSG